MLRTMTLKVDLYDHRDVERACRVARERLGVDADALAADLDGLTAALERHLRRERAKSAAADAAPTPDEARAAMTPERVAECLAFARAPGLIARINAQLGAGGIVGEEAGRLLLFSALASHAMPTTLHVLVQGSSGSGKSRLLDVVTRSMPAERVRRYTRVTDNAFYNQHPDHFRHTALVIEDMDGLAEDAELALRELQTSEALRTATSVKDERTGRIGGGEKVVWGPVASAACTTRGEVYEDNVSRCVTVAVDESAEQTARIIEYQNARAAGEVSRESEEAARSLLADYVRLLDSYEVVNPYAARVAMPAGAHKVRRLNELYLTLVRQVTLMHQHQRAKDARGRLVATVEDLRAASAMLFEAIVLKCDELDGSLRQFYERLKSYLGERDARGGAAASSEERGTFTQREVRSALGVSAAACSRHVTRLVRLEYAAAYYADNLRRKCYRLTVADDYVRLRRGIRAALDAQIDAIEGGDGAGDSGTTGGVER